MEEDEWLSRAESGRVCFLSSENYLLRQAQVKRIPSAGGGSLRQMPRDEPDDIVGHA